MAADPGLLIAAPSKGRLRERSLSLLERAGLRFRVAGRRLFSDCSATGARILFCNVADIPVLVAQGAAVTDLDGPLLLAEDRAAPLHFDERGVHPSDPALWG